MLPRGGMADIGGMRSGFHRVGLCTAPTRAPASVLDSDAFVIGRPVKQFAAMHYPVIDRPDSTPV